MKTSVWLRDFYERLKCLQRLKLFIYNRKKNEPLWKLLFCFHYNILYSMWKSVFIKQCKLWVETIKQWVFVRTKSRDSVGNLLIILLTWKSALGNSPWYMYLARWWCCVVSMWKWYIIWSDVISHWMGYFPLNLFHKSKVPSVQWKLP